MCSVTRIWCMPVMTYGHTHVINTALEPPLPPPGALPSLCTIAHSARRRQGRGERHEMHYTATFRKRLPPEGGFCGMLWDIFPCLHLLFLCRRGWISCQTLSSSFARSHLISCRLSKCPRFCLSMSLSARPCAFRSWRNSWWKCRRSFPIPRHSGLWSSTSTFQFLVVVEDQVLVFKVFLDRVRRRRLPPRNAFLADCGADRWPCFEWTSSWFSPRIRFIFFSLSSWC